MKKPKYANFFIGLFTTLFILAVIFVGGYFVLDKAVVPKYFSSYGINSMGDLVGMMRTLYNLPSEEDIVNNGHGSADLSGATEKLTAKGYPIDESGQFDFDKFNSGVRGNGDVYLTDRELASILNKLLETTEFSDVLPELSKIDTLLITLRELTISPEKISDSELSETSAHIKFIIKIDTTGVRSQMAKEFDIPLFLMNMIIPKQMYMTINYDVEITGEEKSAWTTSNGGISINGSTQKQSKILLGLLISFIFPHDQNMDSQTLVADFGHIIEQGVDLFGDIRFAHDIGDRQGRNGIYFLPVE